ncbi:lysozyme [Comamonas aquatica]|uniref:lysozyme n=1 Tax=Comamonas aquatica TaxID=225991 RepID=UPI0024491D4E|nr:glycoside hydrolase family protein [Comamonas aquatica]MDH0200710.1 glycoside hydrolase family protein [Comamonas aquatica]MDH1445582.1 glycoside hydrolase family protein [Comamonas aquatica]
MTEEQARATLIKHTEQFGSQVLKCLNHEPTQGQYDAFVLAALNFGTGAPGKASGFCWQKSGRPSTIVQRFNSGDEPGACLALLQWVNVNGKFVKGLHNRRWQEYQLCVADTNTWKVMR